MLIQVTYAIPVLLPSNAVVTSQAVCRCYSFQLAICDGMASQQVSMPQEAWVCMLLQDWNGIQSTGKLR